MRKLLFFAGALTLFASLSRADDSPESIIISPDQGLPSVVLSAVRDAGGAPEVPQAVPADIPAAPANPPDAAPLIGATFAWERVQGAPIPGLTDSERWAACGLVAAEGLNRFFAKDPNLDRIVEIKNIAAANGFWDENSGMHGPPAEQALLANLGIQVDINSVGDLGSAEQTVVQSLQRGKPGIISTLRHYFLAEGYSNGLFFVGHSGEVMRGYGPQMTLSQISQAGNGSLALLIPR